MDTDQMVLSPETVAFKATGENGPDQALSGRSALVLYGSETGNAQDIAEDLGRTLGRLRFHTSVVEMDDAGLKELLQYRLVVFVVSTTGQGEMPQNASKFWRSLLRRKLPPSCLTRLAYTCFGLGDSSYPKYNWAARKLCKRLAQLGALEFFASGEGDERHEDGIDTVYLPWKWNLRSWALANHPLPGGMQPIPDQEPLPPRFTLFIDESAPPKVPPPAGQQSGKAQSPSEEPHAAALLLPIPGGITATVQSNERVTPADHWQDVRLLRLDLEAPPAEPLRPGATVTIYPKNSASDVDALIERMRWQEQADRPLRFHAAVPKGLSWCSSSTTTTMTTTTTTLRDLLTHGLDITAVPRRGFLEKLSFFAASDPDQAERLRELADPAGAHDFYDYTARPRRTILEVLRDFPSAVVPAAAAADVFPVIRGREFSIANGGASLTGSSNSASSSSSSPLAVLHVEILAAMVEYRTIIRRPRVGLCSRYLGTLQPGARITVTLKQGSGMLGASSSSLSSSNSRPIIAVATGTGIAPIRMLHHTRIMASPPTPPTTPPGEMLLFFGCRSRRADYYFADEWRDATALAVIPAFSRDPDASSPTLGEEAGNNNSKNYVQHQIRRHARRVADLVARGATVCICGGAGAMPKAVRLALEDALVAGGLCAGPAEAAEYLATKVDIWQETW